MTVDLDVHEVCKVFGVDERLIQAVVRAEGDIVKAVQCSFPSVTSRQQALEITCRSAVHAMSDFVKVNHGPAFVAFWGARWAPVGASNDPQSLNAHWVPNVTALWLPKPTVPV